MVTAAFALLLACGDTTTSGDSATSDTDLATTTDTAPAAGIAMTPTLLELSTSNGEPATGSYTISSTGDAALELTDIAYGDAGVDLPGVIMWMTQGPLPVSIPAGSTSTLSIEWTPDRPGDTTPLETDLRVTSNAAEDPVYTVQLTGTNSAR